MLNLHDSLSISWDYCGDFNFIAHPSKSSNFNGFEVVNLDIRYTICHIKSFSFYHAFIGPNFTWSNHRLEGFIVRKLERVLINDIWLTSFLHSSMEFLTLEDSDHFPVMIHLFIVSNSSLNHLNF